MPRFLIDKLLPWLSIRSKLIIAFVGLSIIPLLLVGLHSIFSNVNMMEKIALENLTHDVHTIREHTANFLSSIESDLHVLRHSSLLERFITVLERTSSDQNKSLLQQLQSEILAFARTKEIYYQIRIVDSDGDELIRIEALDVTDTGTTFRVVRANELRHGCESFYFLLIDRLTRDQITFATSELVDKPNRRIPVMSFAIPLIGSKDRVGILIANVFAKNLFRAIEAKRHLEVQGKVVLVNSDGHYLYHSEKKKDWNRLLASREEDNLQHDYPVSTVNAILSGNEGTLAEGVDEIVSYGPLFSTTSSGKVTPGFAMPFFVFESVPKGFVLGPVRSFALTFSSFLGVFLIVAIGLGLLATRQFTKPIAELHHGAEIISKGNYGHRLHVETHDEIEKLAGQFNAMASSLESHEKEIQQHRTKLEEMVRKRTYELNEEKTKLQAILDHVPSAIVLLDKDFQIRSASAAFSTITGRRFEDVKGKDCRAVFFKGGFCRECVCRRAMASRKIESHIDQTCDDKSGERFVEHIAIPMNENGDLDSILEIITDVTERKRFEKNLVQTERLAAAGEMSAIIAHEFRNSLTSIKMILQLHNESENLNRSERKSLDVALNSIEQMENIVAELLNFARPKPMEFQVKSLNNIIVESLVFAQPQISKQNIAVKKMLDSELPPFLIDESHMKEAIMNVLINAAHAVNNDGRKLNRSEIQVLTKRECLRKTLRDFGMTDSKRMDDSNLYGAEIVLRKGTDCAVVEINDNGCGIERQTLSRIFDPFFTTKTNGTGLGLPMVKRTVNAHGGIVAVSSTLGKGTTVKFYLPLDHET
ncbi:MAG: PAS domain S-box protein [Ignavibacteriae bacterium]|nr:PAS domain S-box protein [Ignavibacteriota bacterium]